MVEAQSVGEVLHAPSTDQTRENASRSRKNAMQKENGKPIHKATKGGTQANKTDEDGEIMTQIQEVINLGKEGLQLTAQNPTLALILANIVKRTEQLEKATQKVLSRKVKTDPNQNQNQILLSIQKKVEALERRLGGVPPSTGDRTTTAPRAWSNVVKESHLPARVEVRLNEMEGTTQETSEERLEKIKKAIPDAKAIIPHPRAINKVSVIIRDKRRRD